MKYYGKRVYEGIAVGKIIRFLNNVDVSEKSGLGYEFELNRFSNAKDQAIKEYKEIYKKSKNDLDEQHADIVSIYIALLEDLDFIDSVEEKLKEGVNAEYAVKSTCDKLSNIFLEVDNDYLKERVKDLKDACNKLIHILLNINDVLIKEPCIIIADEMTVADLLQIDKKKILGLVLEDISPNAHISILARSLSIPTIASLDIKIEEGLSEAIIDGKEGMLYINPSDEEIKKYLIKKQEHEESVKTLNQYKNADIKTIDGKSMKVYANISSHLEVDSVIENNADGIGLFRSEYLYLNTVSYPTEEEQYLQYVKVIKLLENKTVIIRTFDIGADKKIDYFSLPIENNPALGYRGVRLYNDYKEVFLIQLQALYRASVYGNLKVMIPMITNKEEVLFVKEMLRIARGNLKNRNIKFNEDMKIGIMIETPAAALICDELADLVDFFSIGTNDLSQYTLAIDRENPKILNAFNPYHKSILKLIYYVSRIAKSKNIEVGICGELARDEKMLEFFLLCNIDEISVSPSYVLQCKKNITQMDCSKKNINEYI